MRTITFGWVTWAALNAAYGPYTAVPVPEVADDGGHFGDGHSSLPAAVSMGLAVVARAAVSRNGGPS